MTIQERFDSHVLFGRSPGACDVWMGDRNTNNRYGRFRIGDHLFVAHRVAWMLKNGYVPDGKLLLHRCDNPGCVKAEHLFLGDCHVNMKDMFRKGRGKRQFPAGVKSYPQYGFGTFLNPAPQKGR